MTQEQKYWWGSLDMKDPYLSKIWFSMFGTTEQRVMQLFIVKENLNLKTK